MLVLPVPVASQTDDAAVARTPWGDPNLQGTWSYASLTPLQRPTSMSDREFFTAEEAAQRNYSVTLDQPPAPRSVGSYNALWFDRGEVSSDLRTSLIVEPTRELAAQVADNFEIYGKYDKLSKALLMETTPMIFCLASPISFSYTRLHIVFLAISRESMI